MEELMIMLSAALPTDEIISRMEEHILDYKINPSEKNRDMLGASCSLYLTHLRTKGSIEGAIDLMDQFKKFEQREKLFQTDKN